MVIHACNYSSWEVGAEGSTVQKFKASLDYIAKFEEV